jgi:hypothetical protein
VAKAPAPAKAPPPAPAKAAPAKGPRTVSTLDMSLAIVAAVIAIGAIISLASLMYGPWALAWMPAQ